MIKLINEMKAERFTSLDRGMLRDAKENVVIVSARLDGQRGLSEARTEGAQFSLRVGRLRRLEQMGLAEEKRTGVWAINPGSKYGWQAEALGSWTSEARLRRPQHADHDDCNSAMPAGCAHLAAAGEQVSA